MSDEAIRRYEEFQRRLDEGEDIENVTTPLMFTPVAFQRRGGYVRIPRKYRPIRPGRYICLWPKRLITIWNRSVEMYPMIEALAVSEGTAKIVRKR